MSWFERQIETRRRLDDEQLADTYARLAASVMGDRRTPRFTMDDADAADSAVSAVLSYYGEKPGKVVDSITDPDARIDAAIRPSGMMKRAVQLEGFWWKDATGAYIGKLKTGEPVAIIPTGVRGYGYVVPGTNRKVRVNASTSSDLDSEAYCLYRPLPSHELNVTDLLRFMRRALDRYDYLLIAFASLAVALVGLLPAIANELLFSKIIPSGVPSLILPIAAMLVGVAIAQATIGIARTLVVSRFQSKLLVQMEAAIMARTLTLPPQFFKRYESGSVANRVMAISHFVELIAQTVIGTGLTSVFSLVYIVQLFAYAPSIAVAAIVVLLVQLGVGAIVAVKQARVEREMLHAYNDVAGLTPSLLGGIVKIKLAGAEKRAFSKWGNAYSEYSKARFSSPFFVKVSSALPTLIALLGTIAIYFFAGITNVSVADYMAFNVAYGAVSGAVMALTSLASTLASMGPLLEELEPLLKAIPEQVSTGKLVTSLSGSVEVSNVTFRYEANQTPILNGISLKIKAHEYVAIVGESGCGKSTLLRLLLGFETPERGSISYNGQDLAEIDVRSLRRQIGVCLQSGSLFAGDIFSNIAIAAPHASMDDAWEAAELAGIADDIRKMPMGMHTLISEGSGGVSGGQRQRIMIAQAICAKPKILMFDEATSSLDNVTQRHISDALASLDCTRIVVAHRLSTIRLADRILLIEGGKVKEEGTYDELIAADGAFAKLVERQRLEGE